MKFHYHHLARWLLAVMLVAVVQPLLVVPKAHAATLIPETPISPVADKSYDKYGHYETGLVPGDNAHLVGYGRDPGENYGDSFYAIKYKIDSTTMNTSKAVAKAEFVIYVQSYNVENDVPVDKRTFKLYTSADTGWEDTDSHVISEPTLTAAGTYGTGVFQTNTTVRLDITPYFNAYRAANPSATEITFFMKGPLEAELPAALTQAGATTEAFALIADKAATDAAKRPHLDLYYSPNTAPTGISLSNSTVAENSPSGTAVGTLSATDAEGGAMTYSLAAGGADNGSFQIVGNQLLTAASFNYEAKNSYSIKVQVADSENMTYSQNFTINISNVYEAPTGAIVINGGQTLTNNESVSLTLTGTDPDNDALTMSFSNNNSTWSAPEAFASTKTYTLPSGDGAKTIYFKVIDTQGLNHVSSSTITLDKTPPTGSLSINGGAALTSSLNVTLGMTASDLNPPVTLQVSNDGVSWSTPEAFAATKLWTLAPGDGSKTVSVKLQDAAGNTAVVTDTIGLDTTPPDGTLSIEGGLQYTKAAAVNLNLTNPDGSATQMQFQNESGAWSGWEPYASTKNGWTLSGGDGIKTVNAQLRDAAGNTITISDTITLDTTPPVVTGVTEGDVKNTDITLTFDGDGVLNGSPFSSGSKVTAEGSYTLIVTDGAGNTTTVHFSIDKTAPDGSIAINGGATATKSASVTLAVSNSDASAVQMQFSNDGTTWSAWESYDSTKSWTLAAGDGTKTVSVQLKDAAGNVRTVSDTIKLDTLAPVITGVADGGLYNVDPDISFNEGDGDLDGAAFSGGKVTSEGTHTLTVTDEAGNATAVTFTLDKTAPDGTLTLNGGAEETNTVTVNLTISNPDASAVQMRFSNDGSTWSPWEVYAGVKNGWELSTGDGAKTVRVELRDAAGNIRQASDSITLDMTAPNGSLTIDGGKADTKTATVNLQVSNPDASAVSMRFQNESGAWSAWEAYAAVKNGWTLSSSDGLKTVNAELKDAAGNVLAVTDTINLDTVAPVITGATDGGLYNADLDITFNEGVGDLDGQAFNSGDKVTDEGTHTLTVTDLAGNATAVTFTLDKTAPSGTVIINGGSAATNDTTVNLTVNNPDGTAKQMRFSNDGSTWSVWETYAASKSWALGAVDGSKTVMAELKDEAGNVSQVSASITLDTIAPDGSLTIAGGKTDTNNAAVDLQLTNPDGTAVSMRFQNESGIWSTWEPFEAEKNGWTLSTGEGVKTVNAQLRDAVGNVFGVSDTITFDKTAPIINGVTDGELYNIDLNITFNEGSGDLDGAPFSGGLVTAEGAHTLTVTDPAGNVTAVTFTLDKTAPAGTVVINGGAADTKSLTAALALTSDGTAVLMRFSNDGSTWSTWEAYAAAKSGWALAVGDGTKTVSAQLKDAAGNVRTVTDTINLDTVAPVITGAADGGLYNADLDITFNEGSGELDGEAFNSGDKVTAEGTHTLTVTDPAGNVTAVTFTLDKTAPNGTVVINGGSAATNDAAVNLTVNNPDGTAKQMRFSNDGSTWSAWETYASAKSWALSAVDGSKTVRAELRDEAGNVSAYSDTIELDTVAPAITGVTNGGLYNVDLTITFDEGDGVIGGAAFNSGDTVTTEGTHTLTVTDDGGNVTTVTFTLDKTAPSGAITINGGAAATNDTTVDLAIGNPDGTAEQMRLSNDGSAWGPWEPYGAAKNGWTISSGDGSKSVYVELKDAAGNVSQTSDVIELDTAVPVIAGVTNGGLYNADVTITFNEGTGDLNGTAFNSGDKVTAEGAHTLTVTDDAGNVTTVSFTLDKTAPSGTIVINGGAGLTNSLSAQLTITSDGTADQMRFSNDGTTWSAWESYASNKSWTLAAGDGAKSVHVQLRDTAGNIGTMNDTIQVDMTPPTGSAMINGGAPITTSRDIVVTVTASGAAQISYSVDNGMIWSAWSPFIPTLSVKLPDGFGTKIVQVKLKDAAGNESTPFSDSITYRSVPAVNNYGVNGTEDTPYRFSASDYAATNEDGTAISAIEIVSLPAHGSLALGESTVKAGDKLSAADAAALSFTPEADWNGQTSLTWKGEFSGVASSSVAVLTLNIAAVNDAPIALSANYATIDGAEVKGTLSSTDIDGDALTYSIVNQPSSGQLQLDEATGSFIYKPEQTGTFTFTYRTFDGTIFSNVAEVSIKHSYTPMSPGLPAGPTKPVDKLATFDGNESSPLNSNMQTAVTGTHTVSVTINGDKWKGDLPSKPGEPVKIVITPSADAGVVRIDSSMAALLDSGSRGVTVELGGHSITLPDNMISQLAGFMKSSTAVLRIEIAKTNEADAEAADQAAKKSGARVVAVPMQYQVYIEDGGQRTDLSSFNGYLDIHYKAEELKGANPTTAALVGTNGKLRPLPTKFDRTSGSTDIRVHGLTHGTFVLIETDAAFNDTKGHWAEESIGTLADRLVINGVGAGKFQPNRTATRAEFSSILVQAFGMYGRNQALNYSDTAVGSWYEEALQYASGYGIITGYADGSFRPNATITREEAMVIMARAAGLLGLGSELSDEQITNTLSKFGDQEALHKWSREAAGLCVTLGIVNGIGEFLQPGQPITRAQLAVMVENLLKKADYI